MSCRTHLPPTYHTRGVTVIEGLPVGAFANGIGVVTVILIVGWLVARGKLVPERYYNREVERAENYRKAAETLLAQNTELITDKDLSLELLRAIRGYAQAKRGEDL